jgi:hypothetical protein
MKKIELREKIEVGWNYYLKRSCIDNVFFKEKAKSRGHNSINSNWTGLP